MALRLKHSEYIENQDKDRDLLSFLIGQKVYDFEDTYSRVDWYLLDSEGKVDNIIEHRRRYQDSKKKGVTFISYSKFKAIKEKAEELSCEGWFMTFFDDCAYRVHINHIEDVGKHFVMTRSGVHKRGTKTDTEEGYEIQLSDIECFTRLRW